MRIFVDPEMLAAGELSVHGDEHHYLARVRRARSGDAVEVVDGAGRRARGVIARIGERETIIDVSEPEVIAAEPPFVRALLPLIKGERMDLALEKLVEVGVDAIVVWPAARSVVRLGADRRDARLAKYEAAVRAAARQCGRAQVPTVAIADTLAAAVATLPPPDAAARRLVLDPSSDDALAAHDARDVTIVSGPEGGLAPDELDVLARADFVSVGLGPRILRAETAPVIAIALLRAVR